MEREKKRTHFKRTYEKVLLKFSGKENKEKEQDKSYEEQHHPRLRPNWA